ncbi:MAG: biotin transporter BioY [Dehalococcoidia bacterium]
MTTSPTSSTLAEALWPRVGAWPRDLVRDLALIVGFAAFVALCAQIAVRLPFTTVPITGQTFAVLVTGGALGMWRGAGALGLYMVLGSVGLPIFAPGSGVTSGNWDLHFILPWSGSNGWVWDLSSGGYIVGFVLSASLVGRLAEQGWDRKPWVHLGMFLGNVLLYVPGILWLAYLIGSGWVHPVGQPLSELIVGEGTWDKALKGGLYPFIIGDFIKLFLASLTLPAVWSLLQLKERRS